MIGVNKYRADADEPIDVLKVDNSSVRRQQFENCAGSAPRATPPCARRAGGPHRRAPARHGNLLALAVDAARAKATVGEISDALEKVFGRHTGQIRTISGVYRDEAGIAGHRRRPCGVAAFERAEGRRPRILVAKMGQDGHDRGQKVIATAFADLGFDVDVGPLFQTPAEVARQAVEADVHIVGVSSLAAGHLTLVPALRAELAAPGRDDILVVVGGVIPPDDFEEPARGGRGRHLPARHVIADAAARPAGELREARAVAMRRRRPTSKGSRRAPRRPARPGDHPGGVHQARPPGAGPAAARRLPHAGGPRTRVGVTGVPGVGKSTFIDTLGAHLTGAGHRVAVLAVDPSSTRSGGSILGDKTRMARLAVDPAAFIRPSPTSGTLGGVARATREAMVVVEAAGYDVVLVETVGVGQSETAVADMVDTFLLLTLARHRRPAPGHQEGRARARRRDRGQQGRRRARAGDARKAARELAGALRLLRSAGPVAPVLTCSGLTGDGLEELWGRVVGHHDALEASGELAARRRRQQVGWTWTLVRTRLLAELRDHPEVAAITAEVEREVLEGVLTPALAADRILAAFTR